MMEKNVMIPHSLLDQIIDLLESWEIPLQDAVLRNYYDRVLYDLRYKKRKLELRDTYAKIIRADNDEDRDIARINYLRQKRYVAELEGHPF